MAKMTKSQLLDKLATASGMRKKEVNNFFKVFTQKFPDGAYSQVDLCVDCQSVHWSRVEGRYDLGHWRDEGGNAGADEMKAYAQMVGYAKEPGR